MRLRSSLSVVIATASFTAAAVAQPADQNTLRAAINARIEAGTADPVADAQAAAARGEFGLIVTGDGAMGGRGASGVICFTPGYNEPRAIFGYAHSDYITDEVARWLNYASA